MKLIIGSVSFVFFFVSFFFSMSFHFDFFKCFDFTQLNKLFIENRIYWLFEIICWVFFHILWSFILCVCVCVCESKPTLSGTEKRWSAKFSNWFGVVFFKLKLSKKKIRMTSIWVPATICRRDDVKKSEQLPFIIDWNFRMKKLSKFL